MNFDQIKQLPIEDVFIDENSKNAVNLCFIIENRVHLLPLERRNGRFVPDNVIHVDLADCPLCHYDAKDDDYSCSVLSAVKEELFHYLIMLPSVRLEWLFIDGP